MGLFKKLTDTLAHAWNAFTQVENSNYRPPIQRIRTGLYSSYSRPDRMYFSRGNDKSIVTAIYNRVAIDVSSYDIKHVRLDKKGRYIDTMDSSLNNCLTLSANKDQTHRAFIQDIVQSMLDEGCIAVVPIDTDINPETASYDIESMRVGKIVQWFPDDIEVEVYNDRTGNKQNLIFSKKNAAIIENPLYAIVNAPNSVLQRLIRKLNLLDVIDEQSGSGKLDLIIQLPYIIKTDARKKQAAQRKADIENQLANSKYGIAYTDGTEKITQLNRPVENNLLNQITYLTRMVYAQLGTTEEILNGTANEETMLNYQNRTIQPILNAITDEFKRKFLTKTARTQGQSIMYFVEPFKMIPAGKFAEMADKFTRNEILSTNEVRQMLGLPPSSDPKADELRNKNLNAEKGEAYPTTDGKSIVDTPEETIKEENVQNGN